MQFVRFCDNLINCIFILPQQNNQCNTLMPLKYAISIRFTLRTNS